MFDYNGKSFEFDWMGLFTTAEKWIHPDKCESTYEIIYVVKGEIHLYEGENKYDLSKGELVILRPGTLHGGSDFSTGETSFYWLHFRTDLCEKELPKKIKSFAQPHLFKELLHLRNTPYYNPDLVNASFLHLFYSIMQASEEQDENSNDRSLAADVCEWVRINADARLTVEKTAEHFGYNSEYISRLIRKKRGITLKKLIDRTLILRINDLLCNSHYYIKEISDILKFSEPSALVNFYKYHQKMTPAAYRNRFSMTHMNKE